MSPDNLVERYFGSENEYSYTTRYNPARNHVRINVPEEHPHIKDFLSNAARLYIDHGFPEYATPECPSLDELVAHELAGEELVYEFMQPLNPDNRFHKRCISPDGLYTTGYHENYSTEIDIWNDDEESRRNIASLAAHFSTRYLYIGAGKPLENGYAIGQKVHGINEYVHLDTVRMKPLVNTRYEPHKGGETTRLERLHVTSGDANISPWALRMKFGATSCVLRLIEHGVPLDDVHLHNPLKTAYTAGGTVENANHPQLTANGRYLTPLDIQELLAIRTLNLSRYVELPEEEVTAVHEWLEIIDALRQYYGRNDAPEKMKQLDWYTKQEIWEARQRRDVHGENGARIDADGNDLLYDRLLDGKGRRLRESGGRFAQHAPAESAVEKAKTLPPEQGRAKLRGGMVLAAYNFQKYIKPMAKSTSDWGNFVHNARNYPLGAVNRQYSDEDVAERNQQCGFQDAA